MKEFTGLEYIKIAAMNAYGYDKKDWEARLMVFDNTNWVNRTLILKQAEEPILMQKALNAYNAAIAGTPTGYIMGLDATASGLQLMACLIGCKKTAEAVNLINTGHREDVYEKVAQTMGVTREECKKPVMTYFYGSKAEPKIIFGNRVGKFYNAVEKTLPGAAELMDAMQSCWDSTALVYSWVMPDGHNVITKNMVAVDKKIEIDELNHATFTHRIYENMSSDYGKSLAANIVHSVDGYVVREMYRMAESQRFDLLTIHDSFWCSPNHMQKVRENYLKILISIADSNLMQSILRQVTNHSSLVFKKKSNNLSKFMADAEYALS